MYDFRKPKLEVLYNARNSAAVKLVTKASQWRKISTRESGRKGRIKVLVKTNQTSPNSMGLRRLITEFLWPPSSSIIRPWLPYSIKVLVKTNQTSPNSMGLRRLITEFLWPPSSSIIRR
ncbi:hypothetical protein EVAR_6922_1 [Eumeta japonica]|uniref:Uncharacterized protein n=1 Tax=Eumeta variegata TaxID=151549 RepID=A0A4C1TJJ7_EUMVA|nr:hypothetical protein EVAR_6922_1 [Eumeta japonica]